MFIVLSSRSDGFKTIYYFVWQCEGRKKNFENFGNFSHVMHIEHVLKNATIKYLTHFLIKKDTCFDIYK